MRDSIYSTARKKLSWRSHDTMTPSSFEIIEAGESDGRAFMNSEDMNNLGLDELDVIVFVSEYDDWGAAQVIARDDCTPGFLMVDSMTLDSANMATGDIVNVKKSVPKGGIVEVQIGVEPMGRQPTEDAVMWVADHASDMTSLLKNRPIFRNLEINWRDADIGHLKLKIIQTTPPIDAGETAIIDPTGHEIVYEIIPAVDMSFNAILCIDVSGSMLKEDLLVRDVDGAIEGLRRGFQETREFQRFLDLFREGDKVSRIASATLATLLYLSLKIGRGWGENVQLITFGDDVGVLEVENKKGRLSPVIECTGEMRELNLNTVAQYVVDRAKNATGLTAMSVALQVAAKQIPLFPKNERTGKQNPTMVVILSDGNPNKGDELKNIPVNPIPVLKQHLMKSNVVVYTIGIGEADDVLMSRLAELGRGEYFRATSFQDLWRFYDILAQKFSIAAKVSPDS
ncbi:VWA domain-containing protein [Candidatus Bathyarchaeota archaeon]|nr:VWA domain-containing protein [Candidatus Bathyarchaeota archaeon]